MATQTDFTVNETMVFVGTFHDSDGDPVDPVTPVEIRVIDPDGNKSGPFTANKKSEGVFEYEYTPSKVGTYRWQMTSKDGLKQEGERFVTRPDDFS